MSQRQPRDRDLVERSRNGDEAAYGVLVERYAALVRGIAIYQGAQDDVDDVTQEVFLRAWSSLDQLDKADRFGPWVAQIARNMGHSWRRRRRLRRQGEVEGVHHFESDAPPLPAETAENNQSIRMLRHALDDLAPEIRLLLSLHYLEGCSYRQISRCLDIPVATVRWRLMQGMRRLRSRLPAELQPPTRDHAPLRRAVLGALALAVPMQAVVRRPPAPSWWWAHRRLLTGVGLSALAHVALLEWPGDSPATAISVSRYGPRLLAPRWSTSEPSDATAGLARRRPPVVDVEDLAAPPTPPRVAALTDDAVADALFQEPPEHRRPLDPMDVLRQMARQSMQDTTISPQLELLRLQDLDASGRHHGVVIIDSTDKRNLRGYVHFPAHSSMYRWPLAQAGRSLRELPQYLRMYTGLEARYYEGNRWGTTRRDEWLEFPILFSSHGLGPFATPDHWTPEARLGPRLSSDDGARLTRYLRGGGFLFVEGDPWYLHSMVGHVRQALKGDGRLVRLPFDHPIYHSYYDFPRGFPGEHRPPTDPYHPEQDPWYFPEVASMATSPYSDMWGVELDGQVVAVFSRQNLLSLQAPTVSREFQTRPVRSAPTTPWLRAMTNVVVYALTRDGSNAVRRPAGFWEMTRHASYSETAGM